MIEAGHQPNYLPWLGFFDKMLQCDVFFIDDIVQFEPQGFINRNRIKTYNGIKWLTVPIQHVGKLLPINEIKIANNAERDWANRHWLTIKCNYLRAPYWEKYSGFFEETYNRKWTMLIDLNMHLINGIMQFLKIKKSLTMASSLGVSGKGSELVLAQCKALGTNIHLSGTGGHNYLNLQRFKEEGIEVIFQNFQHPVHPQLRGEFVPNLSAVDYLFWTGGKPWKNPNKILGEDEI